MSFYQKATSLALKFFKANTIFKYGLNWSPMYRRSSARINLVSEDIMFVKIRLPYSYKNRNFMDTIFGGSMFASVDPIPLIQLVNIIGKAYVVWDKSAVVYFKRPAKEDLYAEFSFSHEEIQTIKDRIVNENEIEIVKVTQLTDRKQTQLYCEVHKTIYIAEKNFYKSKRALKKNAKKGH